MNEKKKTCNETMIVIFYFRHAFNFRNFPKIRDTFTEQIAPHQLDYGHLTENPTGWEERYERKNLKSQRFQGKVWK